MITRKAQIKVYDNSGANTIECFHLYTKTSRKNIGQKFLASVKTKKTGQATKIKKGQVVKAVLVQTKKKIRRLDGSYQKAASNAALLLQSQGEAPLGTRVLPPIPYTLPKKTWAKVHALARYIV